MVVCIAAVAQLREDDQLPLRVESRCAAARARPAAPAAVARVQPVPVRAHAQQLSLAVARRLHYHRHTITSPIYKRLDASTEAERTNDNQHGLQSLPYERAREREIHWLINLRSASVDVVPYFIRSKHAVR